MHQSTQPHYTCLAQCVLHFWISREFIDEFVVPLELLCVKQHSRSAGRLASTCGIVGSQVIFLHLFVTMTHRSTQEQQQIMCTSKEACLAVEAAPCCTTLCKRALGLSCGCLWQVYASILPRYEHRPLLGIRAPTPWQTIRVVQRIPDLAPTKIK